MSSTKIIQYIHRPNLTELGLGNTHETYMLVESKTDMSDVFPPNTETAVEDSSSGEIYMLKSAKGSEFRINQMGPIYRDHQVKPGDEIIITHYDTDGEKRNILSVINYDRICLSAKGNGTEIVNIERLQDFLQEDNTYSICAEIEGVVRNITINFLESKKKRSDSPTETDYYSVKIDGSLLPTGKYYLTIRDINTLTPLLSKSEYNKVILNDSYENKIIKKKEPSLSNRQIIYYGAPGTGKSFEINRITKNKEVIRTTFHPDSDYSTFVGAYKPTMKESYITKDGVTTKEEKIIYTFCPQAFTNAYVEAWNTEEEVYLVIEEINRGNCAQIFGDLFQLLDRKNGVSEYPVEADADLQNYLNKALAKTTRTDIPDDVKSGDKLMLPSNLYIWATMNTSDQSLFPIDSAFKRRWDWKYIKIKEGKDENGNKLDWKVDVKIDEAGNLLSWWDFIQKINEIIASMTSSADKQLGYFFCCAKDGVIDEETFVSKVIFYLWNDVFKDYGFEDASLFRYKEIKDGKETEKDLTFPDFYDEDGENVNTVRVVDFVQKVMNWKKTSEENN